MLVLVIESICYRVTQDTPITAFLEGLAFGDYEYVGMVCSNKVVCFLAAVSNHGGLMICTKMVLNMSFCPLHQKITS